jgi:hypothetical protein
MVHKTKKNKTNTQHNLEKLTTYGTQDEEKQNKNTAQPREAGNIWYTRRRETKQKHNTT